MFNGLSGDDIIEGGTVDDKLICGASDDTAFLDGGHRIDRITFDDGAEVFEVAAITEEFVSETYPLPDANLSRTAVRYEWARLVAPDLGR